MIYLDYVWDLSSNTIIPDVELDTNKLAWKKGDYWQMVEHNGQLILKKVDPVTQFLLEGNDRGCG